MANTNTTALKMRHKEVALLQSAGNGCMSYQTFYVWLPSGCASSASFEFLNTL
jgi:hypothetical protein